MPTQHRARSNRRYQELADQAREARSTEVNPADQEASLDMQCSKCLLVPHILFDLLQWIILHAAETGAYSITGTTTVHYAEYYNTGEIPRFRNRRSNTIIA